MTPHIYRRGRLSRRGTGSRGWAATEVALFLPVFLSLIWILAYAGRWIVWNIGAVNAASSCAQLAGRAGTAQSGSLGVERRAPRRLRARLSPTRTVS